MPRVAVEWRSASLDNYKLFKKRHPNIKMTYNQWKEVIYTYNELYKEYLLETGNKERLPLGLGDFSIIKKKRRKVVPYQGVDYVNLPIDWVKSKEKGKHIYNFNFHTEGFFFGWHWFKESARFRHSDLWYFKATRVTSRLLAQYIFKDNKYQHLYNEWRTTK
jgi:hypothetical protein